MTTYPLPTLAAQITATGIVVPSYVDILASLQATYRGIYGSDVYLSADSQDGQMLAIFAMAINDANQMAAGVYNAFSPATAQGAGLSSVVKINGLARLSPSNSTADLTIVGVAGTEINNGLVGDGLGNQWLLPALVTVPPSGLIVVTATATAQGAILAPANTINKIMTPTLGWQTVTNVAAATPGEPVESDAALRSRQSVSTALAAQTPLDSIVAAVANLPGVTRYQPYENSTGVTDANGIPGHSISLVIEGGDAVQIATAIALKKNPGTGTYGSTTEIIIDPLGIPNQINFYRPTDVRIIVDITIKALTGYVSTTGVALVQAIVDEINALPIGEKVYLSKIYTPANLTAPLGNSYNVTAITLAAYPAAPGAADVAIAFNEAATCLAADITLTVI